MTQFSGWSGYWADFLKLEKETFIEELSQYCRTWDWTKDVSIQQVNAWKHEFDVMQQTLSNVLQETGSEFADQAWISFEHELFGESGKRAADVNLVLPSGHLFLIEFKHKKQASDKEIIRVAFDLAAMLRFHSESIQLDGRAYLVFSREDAQAFKDNHVECDIAVQQCLPKLQQALIEASQKTKKYDVSHWQAGRFIRQPGILSGTVDLFYRQRMPNLKNEAAQNITQAREALLALYDHVRRNKKRYVVMV